MTAEASGSFTAAGQISESLPSYEGAIAGHTIVQTGFMLSLRGLDANNTVKLQKSVLNGTENLLAGTTSWVDVTTYNSDQNNVQITESAERVPGTSETAQHRLICATKEALSVNGKPIVYKMTKERPTSGLEDAAARVFVATKPVFPGP